ncbi:hypothetical protein Avbf_18841, partial [Armadillidium vulgare]
MPDLRRKALRNASRLQLKEKIRNFIKSSSYYMSEEDEQIIKWNKDQLKTGTRKQSLKRENDANLPYAILSAPAHYEEIFERYSEKGNLIRMPDLRRKALRNASRLQLKEKIRNFIKSSSYYMSEEDEQIIKWNKDQLKTGTRKQSLKRENDANLPYAILSAPAHYEDNGLLGEGIF